MKKDFYYKARKSKRRLARNNNKPKLFKYTTKFY